MSNIVYIATSLDGYIADKEGKLDWLDEIPNPDKMDFGFADFIARTDAIVMGRNTFDTVINFDCEWPYTKPVFVLSHSLKSIPEKYAEKAELIYGSPTSVINRINQKGYYELYIDGGITIQNFLKENLIDEMIITTIPILLGGGSPLFGDLTNPIRFEHVKTDVLLNALIQSHYRKRRLT